jgi:hypothetical protein
MRLLGNYANSREVASADAAEARIAPSRTAQAGFSKGFPIPGYVRAAEAKPLAIATDPNAVRSERRWCYHTDN